MVESIEGKGAYKLKTLGGVSVARTWNSVHLKKCNM